VSATQLKAVAPAHAAGTVDVTVTTPGGTSAIVAADHYTYNATPTVGSLIPAAGPIAGGNSVTINGTAASTVVHVSATQRMATVPSTATTGPITVTNTTAPTGTVRSAANYTKTWATSASGNSTRPQTLCQCWGPSFIDIQTSCAVPYSIDTSRHSNPNALPSIISANHGSILATRNPMITS
jgi:hypothetical protein